MDCNCLFTPSEIIVLSFCSCGPFFHSLSSFPSIFNVNHSQEIAFRESSAELVSVLGNRAASQCHTCPKLSEQYYIQQKCGAAHFNSLFAFADRVRCLRQN